MVSQDSEKTRDLFGAFHEVRWLTDALLLQQPGAVNVKGGVKQRMKDRKQSDGITICRWKNQISPALLFLTRSQ